MCFCPHTQAAQIDIKSSCLFLVISVTSSYSLFYPGSLSTSSGPSIWPFLPVASHYMASFVSEAIHPTTGAALTAQGSLRTAETRSPASFPRRHFCPARPRHNKRQFMMFSWARLRWCLFCSSGPTYFNDSSDRSDSLSTKRNHQVSPKIPSVDGLLVAGSPQPPLGEKDRRALRWISCTAFLKRL